MTAQRNRHARHRVPRPAPQHLWPYDPRGRELVTRASVMRDFAQVLSIITSAGYPKPYEVVALPLPLVLPQT